MQILSSDQNTHKTVLRFRQTLAYGGYQSACYYRFVHLKETHGSFIHVVRVNALCKVLKLVKGSNTLKHDPLFVGTAIQCIEWVERQT